MKILNKIIITLIGVYTVSFAFADGLANLEKTEAQSTFRRQLLPNGQTIIVSSQNLGNTVYTDIHFRAGSTYEYDSLNGLSLAICKIIDKQVIAYLRKANKTGIAYSSNIIPSQVSFNFRSDLSQVNMVVDLIKDKILFFHADSNNALESVNEMKADLDSISRDEGLLFQKCIDKKLWGRDYRKINIYGNEKSYLKITAEDLNNFHKKYFLPSNSALIFVGNLKYDDVLTKVTESTKDFISTEFNPEQIIRVLESRPIVNVNQLLFTKNAGDNEAALTYQNPGARVDRIHTYCAFILTSLLNDKNGKFQRSAMAQQGLTEMKAIFECGNFYSTFKLYTKNTGNDFMDQFNYLSGMIAAFGKKDFLNEGELEIAKKNIEIELRELKENNPQMYFSQVAKYRFLNDEYYFSALNDSIQNISIEEMNAYVNNFFSNYAGVRSLKTTVEAWKSSKENQKYLALDESVKNVVFTYEQNITDLEGAENLANQELLLRWLQINPDMHIQINGCADEGEYDRANDKAILDFIDSIPTFRKVKQDLVKKGYLKLEMMRAMKLVKYLYEHGITEDRLNGTSMIFTSSDKDEAKANRKCTVTLEKIKPRLSLYEYHFGKKKVD